MSEVIQPAPGQTVITTDHDRHRHHDGDHFRETRLDADYRALVGGAERNATAAQVASSRTDSLVQGGFGGVHDRLCDATGKIVGALNTGFTAEALAACKVADQMNAGFAAANTQVAAIGSAAQVLATTFAGQARDDATRNAHATSVQATGNFNLLTTQGTENTYKVLLDAQKNASADQIEQVKNPNAVMLKLRECCHDNQQGFQAAKAQADCNACDIKQLITVDGNTTRALVNSIEAERKAERIRFLETRVLVLGGGATARAA